MQIPDVNVLVSAFRTDSPHHRLCRSWLEQSISEEQTGLSELVLSGVFRVLTHPRVFTPPTPIDAALEFVDRLLAQPGILRLRPGDAHWRIFRRLSERIHATGNKVPDVYHAVLAIEHGSVWVTLDRGFASFPELASRNLLVRSD